MRCKMLHSDWLQWLSFNVTLPIPSTTDPLTQIYEAVATLKGKGQGGDVENLVNIVSCSLMGKQYFFNLLDVWRRIKLQTAGQSKR